MKEKFRILIFFSFICLSLFSCSIVDQLSKSFTKATPSEGPTIEQAQKEPYNGPKARIAVTRFEDKSAKGRMYGTIGNGMADMLSNALFATGRYTVLERQEIGDVLREQNFGASGRVKQRTAAKIGEIEGADLLVMGAITEFEPGRAGVGAGIAGIGNALGGLGGGGLVSHVALIIKLVDARTGRLVASEQVEGKAVDIGGILSIVGGSLGGIFSAFAKTPMGKAIRIAIGKAVEAIVAKTPATYYRYGAPPSPRATKRFPNKVAQATPSAQQSSENISKTLYVRVEMVNFRKGPGKNFRIVKVVVKGMPVFILSEENGWFNGRLQDGTTGWIYHTLVGPISKEIKAKDVEAKRPVHSYSSYDQSRVRRVKKVNSNSVVVISLLANVRESYSNESRIITTLENGATVSKIDEAGNWVQVELDDGRKGWIYRTHIGAKLDQDSDSELEGYKNQKSKKLKGNEEWNKSKENEKGGKKIGKWVTVESPWADAKVLVRKGPGVSYDILGKLESGVRVQYLRKDGDWVYIKTPHTKENEGYKGYVYKDFIK